MMANKVQLTFEYLHMIKETDEFKTEFVERVEDLLLNHLLPKTDLYWNTSVYNVNEEDRCEIVERYRSTYIFLIITMFDLLEDGYISITDLGRWLDDFIQDAISIYERGEDEEDIVRDCFAFPLYLREAIRHYGELEGITFDSSTDKVNEVGSKVGKFLLIDGVYYSFDNLLKYEMELISIFAGDISGNIMEEIQSIIKRINEEHHIAEKIRIAHSFRVEKEIEIDESIVKGAISRLFKGIEQYLKSFEN